jgi:hypothetical protein
VAFGVGRVPVIFRIFLLSELRARAKLDMFSRFRVNRELIAIGIYAMDFGGAQPLNFCDTLEQQKQDRQ